VQRFDEGDRVRIDIPDETDPDFEAYHGETGEVVAVIDYQLLILNVLENNTSKCSYVRTGGGIRADSRRNCYKL
jgi:ribosomal protein L21E